MHQEPLYKAYLRQELQRRRQKNARYSLRSFAAWLEMSPGSLSRALNGKASLSIETLERALDKICPSDVERARYLTSFIEEQQQSAVKKIDKNMLLAKDEFIPEDVEPAVSEQLVGWQHYAILELAAIDRFKLSGKTASAALEIGMDEADRTIVQLMQAGLLKRHDGRLVKTKPIIMNRTRGIATPEAIKNSLSQTLAHAEKSLRNDPLRERCMMHMTVPIDPDKIPVAKLMIEQFVMQMSSYLSSGPKRRVYSLNVNLFPIQKINSAGDIH